MICNKCGDEGEFYRRSDGRTERICKACRYAMKKVIDGIGLRPNAPPTPCARCGTPCHGDGDGKKRRNRLSGRPFGVEGVICRPCYRALKLANPGPDRTIHPCARCGDPGGPALIKRNRPDRLSGRPFGVVGTVCRECYRALKLARPVPSETVPPCAWCGTHEGDATITQKRPDRMSGRPYGVEGEVCRDCYEDLKFAKAVPDIIGRIEKVRAAKDRKVMAGLWDTLTDEELDRVLPRGG